MFKHFRIYRSAGSQPIRPGFEALKHVRSQDTLTQAAPGDIHVLFHLVSLMNHKINSSRPANIPTRSMAQLSLKSPTADDEAQISSKIYTVIILSSI